MSVSDSENSALISDGERPEDALQELERRYNLAGDGLFRASEGRLVEAFRGRLKRPEIVNFLRKQDGHSLFRHARWVFPRNRVYSAGPRYLAHADLIDLSHKKKSNYGFSYILVCIDCFTRYAFVEALRSKSGLDVSRGLAKIFARSGRYLRLCVDRATEFYNDHTYRVLGHYKTLMYSPKASQKVSLAERFVRTFRRVLAAKMQQNKTKRWASSKMLAQVLNTYLNRRHRMIGMSPRQAENPRNLERLCRVNFAHMNGTRRQKPKFELDECVRLQKPKLPFRKGFYETYSRKRYRIMAIDQDYPIPMYTLSEILRNGTLVPIVGKFYAHNLVRSSTRNDQ